VAKVLHRSTGSITLAEFAPALLLIFLFLLHLFASQAELLTLLDDASLKMIAPSFPCFERRGNQPQKQMTEPSQHDHINPLWSKTLQNEFEFCVTPHMLSPGQDRHQLVRFSLWHRLSNSEIQELGYGNMAVRDLHARYYLADESTEITIPISSPSQEDGNVKENGTHCCMSFNSFLVFSVSFIGDWSADLEVERLKESKKVKESQLQAVRVAKGDFICFFKNTSLRNILGH
jgi:hypothetical protein